MSFFILSKELTYLIHTQFTNSNIENMRVRWTVFAELSFFPRKHEHGITNATANKVLQITGKFITLEAKHGFS